MPKLQNSSKCYCFKKRKKWKKQVCEKADSDINNGAWWAGMMATIPVPIMNSASLAANEAGMIHKIAGAYGYCIDEATIALFADVANRSIIKKVVLSFNPDVKIDSATSKRMYGIGKAAQAYFESDGKLNRDELRQEFLRAERDAKKREWYSREE